MLPGRQMPSPQSVEKEGQLLLDRCASACFSSFLIWWGTYCNIFNPRLGVETLVLEIRFVNFLLDAAGLHICQFCATVIQHITKSATLCNEDRKQAMVCGFTSARSSQSTYLQAEKTCGFRVMALVDSKDRFQVGAICRRVRKEYVFFSKVTATPLAIAIMIP